jgi:predicted DNA binding protein
MLLTKIKISSKDNFISRLSSEMGVEVEIVRCRANGSAGGLSILRIRSESGINAEDLGKWFNGIDGCSVISIVSDSSGKHLAMVRNVRCTLCKVFLGTDCFLESGCSTGNDSVIWKIYTPNNTALKGMIERIRNEGYKVDLLSVKRVVSAFELTRIQDEAMRLALLTGYYDIPKRITLEELAGRSGISKATLNLILRRGQKKILSDHMRT